MSELEGPGQIAQAFDLFRSAIRLAKDAMPLLPDKRQRKALEETLRQAERASRIAEAEAAKALGFHLCHCEFPPPIMTELTDSDADPYEKEFRFWTCPACGGEEVVPTRIRGATFGRK